MELNTLDLHGLLLALVGARHLPLETDLRDRVVRCRVRTSEWIPDGLALAGHPDIARELDAIDDYPCFDLAFPLPDTVLRSGHDAIAGFGSWLVLMATEIRQRIEEVHDQVEPLKAAFEAARQRPWHITYFDPERQVIGLGETRVSVVTGARRGQREDLKSLFLPALLQDTLKAAAPAKRASANLAHAYIESAVRGAHLISVRLSARQLVQIDLGTRERVRSRKALT